MKEILLAIFTMKGCPHCTTFKELLNKSDIKYSELDIDKYSKEYDMFVQKTGGNEYVPAFMVIEIIDNQNNFHYYAPERDYEELEDAIEIIQNHKRNFNL